MAKLLDAGSGGERSWLVKTQSAVYEEHRGQTVLIREEANVTVTAMSVDIVDGALVFQGKGGELSWAFGPTGWLEVSRA